MRSRRLIRLAFRCYPSWWRDRYEVEARGVANALLEEGRPAWRVTASFAWHGIASRFSSTPAELRQPAAVVVQRADGLALSAALPYFFLALVALASASSVYVGVQARFTGLGPRFAPLPGAGFLYPAVIAIEFAGVLFVLAALGSVLNSILRSARDRDWRAIVLGFVAVAALVAIPVVDFVAVHLLGGSGATQGVTPFAAVLTFQRYFLAYKLSPFRFYVVASVSWLCVLFAVAISVGAARRYRARVRLADAYLKVESALTWVSAIAMFSGWAGLAGWGIFVPAQPVSPACLPTMQGCGLTHSIGPSLTTAWWLIVFAMDWRCFVPRLPAFRPFARGADSALSQFPDQGRQSWSRLTVAL